MKKEQTLLLVAAGLAGLLVWQSTGLYASVGPAAIPPGSDVPTTATVAADPRAGIADAPPAGRNSLRQLRVERRKEPPPSLEMPKELAPTWVRPLPWPSLPPAYWGMIREEMKRVSRPVVEKDPNAAPVPENPDEDPEAEAAKQAAEDKQKAADEARARIENAAQLVQKDGRSIAVRLTPLGADQGQPVWVILEKWGSVRFMVEELNKEGTGVIGRYELGPADAERYQTVHLEKTLENEYNEERIRRGVKDTDRAANIEFATWIRQSLATKPHYGVKAVRLALKHLAVAKTSQIDATLVAMIGETSQEAYDLDEEIKAYRDYLTGSRAADTNVIDRLGDAYERAGALQEAMAQFEKAAKLGDTEGRLRMATLMLLLAEDDPQLEAANEEFQKCATGQPPQRARALAGMARVRMRQGKVAAALQHASDARQADAGSFHACIAHGAALYANGKFAEAEAAFSAAIPLERNQNTHARSNRAMALLAQDKLTDAVADAQACLDTDALNYFDPLLVLAEAQQRWGDETKSTDLFETARQRNPRNPWILLRLAGSRLAGGDAAKALEILRGTPEMVGLLQIAPESVDALHVAGLACARLEQPDWAGAQKYLRRALDKEPRNLDLIYDLSKSLHLAGKTEDAVRLLEDATNANTGVAKNDPRCLALLAYVYYDSRRPVDVTFATLDRARRATPAPWTLEWVQKSYQTILDWDKTRVWEDPFNRSGGEPRNGWDDDAEILGVLISVDSNNCVFNGRMAASAAERAKYTGMFRTEDLAGLLSTDVVIKPDAGFEFVIHLWTGDIPPIDIGQDGGPGKKPRRTSSVELGFGANRSGQMKLWVYSGGAKMFDVQVKNADGTDRVWPIDEQFHKVSFRRVGLPAKGGFEIYLDDEKVLTPEPLEIGGLSSQAGRTANFGIHVDADQGAQVNLRIDSVQVEKILGKR